MKLTPRLKAIANLIPSGVNVADVGSDHGYLAVYLYQSGRNICPIASDINQGPIDNALETLVEEGLQGQIEVRLGGGLLPYKKGEVDVAVIAGMGGILIRDIIVESLPLVETLDFLVVQPMTQQPFLREWLCANGFEIFNETFVSEGSKFYEIFCVRKGSMPAYEPHCLDIGFGRLAENHDILEYEKFLTHKIDKLSGVKAEIEAKGSVEAKASAEVIAQKLVKLSEVLSDVRQR